MSKRDWQSLNIGSPEYVVKHGQWAQERGRSPSAHYAGITNPKKAFKLAANDLEQTGQMLAIKAQTHGGKPIKDFEFTIRVFSDEPSGSVRRAGFFLDDKNDITVKTDDNGYFRIPAALENIEIINPWQEHPGAWIPAKDGATLIMEHISFQDYHNRLFRERPEREERISQGGLRRFLF